MLNYLQREILTRFDPDYNYFKQAIRTGLVCLLSILVYRAFPATYSESYWVVLAAVFLVQTRLGATQWQQMRTLSLCVLSAAILGYLSGFVFNNPIYSALFLAVTTFIAIYLSVFGLHMAIACFFINLYAILSVGLPTASSCLLQRFLMILLGGALALLVCFLWPTRLKPQLRRDEKIYLRTLAEFSHALVENYLHPAYPQQAEKFEYRLHERRDRLLRMLNAVRHSQHLASEKKLLTINEQDSTEEFIVRAEQLFALFISLGNIRHYVRDVTALNFVTEELKLTHQLLAAALYAISEHTQWNSSNLQTTLTTLRTKATEHPELENGLIVFVDTVEKILVVIKCLNPLS